MKVFKILGGGKVNFVLIFNQHSNKDFSDEISSKISKINVLKNLRERHKNPIFFRKLILFSKKKIFQKSLIVLEPACKI